MKKNYIQPRTIIVEIGAETRYLLSGSVALTSQSSDFDFDPEDSSTDRWGRYTGSSYNVLDFDWGN